MNTALDIINSTKMLDDIIHLVAKAGNAIMDVYQADSFDTHVKDDKSPVTKADLLAHDVLVSGLLRLTPNIPIVSEEDSKSIQQGLTSSLYWLLDPLDGTKEFINRNGEFTCNVALIENSAPCLGFVGVPVHQDIYYGGKAIGSFKVDITGQCSKIQCNRSSEVTRIVASKSHLNDETRMYIDKIDGEKILVQAGSSLKFIKIAEGEADLYPRLAPTSEWDTAAAHAILEGAGGSVCQINGEALVYGKIDILNPYFVACTNEIS
jgi:3'(2'), 5'-bisphosphate nucleotidase